MKNLSKVLNTVENIMKMEHLLQRCKCSIFHNIFKYMIFQRRYYGVKGYNPGFIVSISHQTPEERTGHPSCDPEKNTNHIQNIKCGYLFS